MSNDSQNVGTNSPAVDSSVGSPATAPLAGASAPLAPAAPSEAFLTTGIVQTATPTAPVAQDTNAGEPKGDAPEGAPEQYDIKAPEGLKFDDAILGEFSAFAKEKNLSQADAQKFADMGSKVAQHTSNAFIKNIETEQAKWVADSRVDKEFGGDKLAENLGVAHRAMEAFGSSELSQMLAQSGLNNHPEIIRAFFRVGKAISEDKLVPGGRAPAPDNAYAKMYPTMVKN